MRRARWPQGFRCPRCGSEDSHFIASRRLEQCRSCRYQSSVTAGTIFHGTRVPLRVWFLGVYFVARHKRGISALQSQRDAGLGSYQTAWSLLHKLRSTLGAPLGRRLRGAVEADETYIGGYRKGLHGRGHGKTGVAIAVERRAKTAGAVRLAVVRRATTAALTAFVQDAIRPQETTVFTDAWGAYVALRDLGIDHRPRKGGHGHQALNVLPWAHSVFGNLKTWLRGTFHGVSPKHLQRYLDEFVFRFNRRSKDKTLFVRILNRAVAFPPCPYREFAAGRIG